MTHEQCLAVVAEVMRGSEPDRGNRYAPRSVQTKGAAAHEQWRLTCRLLATALPKDGRKGSPERAAFLRDCGIENEEG